MVCIPCIFLPILLAIYLKFIQPFVFRLLPERWVTFVDSILYPTCPARPPSSAENKSDVKGKEDCGCENREAVEATGESKKDL
uniref:UPF0729 protein GD16342 n=1 Tax=Haemonchus contortus TaxID=6289 RepID=A0A7I4Y398_HAECO|nr:Protein F18A11.3 [Haemonchus contortus]